MSSSSDSPSSSSSSSKTSHQKLYWLKDVQKTKRSNFSAFCDNDKPLATVVIIGGGMTGLTTAYWLVKSGQFAKDESRRVLVLEQGPSVGFGATGRNGGHIWP